MNVLLASNIDIFYGCNYSGTCMYSIYQQSVQKLVKKIEREMFTGMLTVNCAMALPVAINNALQRIKCSH